jgi:hypothetical protein
MNTFFLITTVSIASAAVPATAGIINYRSLEREFKLLLGLFMIVVLVEGYSYLEYLNNTNTNTHWVHHIYAPLEYGFFAMVFSYWQKSEIVKKTLLLSIPIFTLICIVNMVLPTGYHL